MFKIVFFLKTDISFNKINKLAIPALIAGIAEPLISITDTAIIGNIDYNAKESLGAIAIVGSFLSMLIWVFAQTRSAVSSIISTYLGANKLEKVKTVPYKHNYGYLFTSGPNTWHGMEKKKIVKERRCIQVNYVTFETDWKVD